MEFGVESYQSLKWRYKIGVSRGNYLRPKRIFWYTKIESPRQYISISESISHTIIREMDMLYVDLFKHY